MNDEQLPEPAIDTQPSTRERWMARARVVARLTRAGWAKSVVAARAVRRSELLARVLRGSRALGDRVWRTMLACRRPVLRVAVLILVVEGAVWALTGPFVQRIPPGMVGVRHSQWGAGVEARDFPAGLHWNLPGLHEWHTIEAGTAFVEFGTFSPALELRTPEGNLVGVAVTVPYRLIEGRAHRLVAESLRSSHADIVRAGVEAVLLTELGRASSEDWLDSVKRREVLEAAGVAVGAELERLHVHADRVLLQALRFPQPYEMKLLEIQRGTQRRRLSEASANLKQFQLIVDRGVEENSRAVQRLRDERDLELTRLRSESKREIRLFEIESEASVRTERLAAERTYAERLNEGRAARLTAEVEARGLVDSALEGDEGRLYLAVQAARALQLGEVVIDSRDPRLPNLLDLESATELFLPAED
jgi:SPFH domain/Band 7 family protein